MNKEYHCCLCSKQADYLVECKTFMKHGCVSIEYKPCCEEHYMQHRKEKNTQTTKF